MNTELAGLFAADQEDRQQGIAHDELLLRDRERRSRAVALVDAGALQTAADLFHAAVLFQHGEETADFERAAALAQRAAGLGHPQGVRLYANACDRRLTSLGQPQKYGTQYLFEGGTWRLMDVDPATTDEERSRWGVPPLAECLRMVDVLNARQQG